MGAGQSSGRGAASVDTEVKTSYYELLGVQRQAPDDEIKKSYRRKALELHPDRNYGNEEQATTTFAEVQAAYEVLSDPQERAWYDSHESAILRGDDGAGQDEAPTYQNVRVTTADDLARMVRKFNSNVDFSDAPSGFFGFIRETFDQLVKEEEVAASWEGGDIQDYPSFGHKDDEYDDVVKRFYATWSGFLTVKTFAWKDKYKLSEAPDRWYRRRMEQENKAYRKEGIKEFNDAVRSLVAFVRKRDPRYIPSTQSEAERQKVLRDAAASQAARARAANQAKFNEAVPEWTKAREPEELEESEEEEVEEHVLECVACNKTFKSEKQWEAHEKSKKHQKAVHALQRKMRKDNAHLDLSDGQMNNGVETQNVDEVEVEEQGMPDEVAVDEENQETGVNGHIIDTPERSRGEPEEHEQTGDGSNGDGNALEESISAEEPSKPGSEEENASDSNYASPDTISARLKSTSLDTPPTTISEAGDELDEDDNSLAKPKMGKAAQKRAKKAAAATASEQEANTHKCATCSDSFPSKTSLFQHIKKRGHAAPKPVSSGGGKGKKAKGNR